jgi:hypothetical protein
MGCLVGGVLVAGLLFGMGSFFAFIGALVWIVAVGTGVNAAGCCTWITRAASRRAARSMRSSTA